MSCLSSHAVVQNFPGTPNHLLMPDVNCKKGLEAKRHQEQKHKLVTYYGVHVL
jgi:hypothetical protein